MTTAVPELSNGTQIMMLAARCVIQADRDVVAAIAPRHERVVMRLDGRAQQRAVAGRADVEAAEREAVEAYVAGVLAGVLVGLLLGVGHKHAAVTDGLE